ncbi:MAG: TetR/AcrR family transcriptional regulator [Actinobacteria bacterium]|nr:TetR/AcrR family transcriptional regulator [Actinomycetota bacterium]
MPRAQRADAVRNRTKILDAARDQITLHGSAAGMDEIAAAAGVAVGTLYRHFPTKTDLVEAVIAEFVGQVADDAESSWSRAQTGSPAFNEVAGFLSRVVDASATNHAIKAAAQALGADYGNQAAEARAGEALARLIAAGQAGGEIHPDVTVADVYLLMSAAPTGQPAAARARWLTLILPGLTNRDRVPLP